MGGLLVTLSLLGAVALLIYIYLVWHFGYWKRLGLKEAKAWPLIGSFPSLFTKKRNVVYDVNEIYQQYRRDEYFVGAYSGRMPQLLLLNPEIVHKVYVNDFKHFHDNDFGQFIDLKKDPIFGNNPFIVNGELWKERRAEVTPGLTLSRVSAVFPVTQKVCKSLIEYIEQERRLATAEGMDAKKICLRYTTEVLSDCVLGVKANSFTDNPMPIYDMITHAFDQSHIFMVCMVFGNIVPQFRKLFMPAFFASHLVDFFVNLMGDAIELRRRTPGHEERIDFLNYMLHLQDKKKLTTFELASHTMTFLTDGYETTANVLAHVLLMLGRHPEAQRRLRDEIGTGDFTFDALQELKYMDAVIHEIIRIFAPQLIARKLCTEDYEFTNKNGKTLKLYKGQTVIIPSYSMQHDADYFEDPEDFKPERFLEENGGVRKWRDMGVYLGFGDGPRMCIGQRFALTQIKAALAEILREFNVKVNAKTRTDNLLNDTFFMGFLKDGIFLDFEKRN